MKKKICAASVAGSLLASGCAIAAADQKSEANRTGTFDLKDFGAACDGRHDDTKAIQAWLNRLEEHVRLMAPAGVCVFSAPLRSALRKRIRHQRGRSLCDRLPLCRALDRDGPAHGQRHRLWSRGWRLDPRLPDYI
jgi:hypothetical protein